MADEGGGGAIRELLAVFGFGVDEEGLRKGENALEGFAEKVKSVASGLAAAFAVHEIKEFADETTNKILEVSHAAERLGISTESVQKFQFAAKALGLETGSLTNLMGRLQVTQAGLSKGGKAGAETFAALGVSTKDAGGKLKSVDQLMFDVADGISKVKDPAKQAAYAVNLFGRSGREILPFLKEGKEGLEKLGLTYNKLGGATEQQIELAKKYKEATAESDQATESLKDTIYEQLEPILEPIIRGFTKWISALGTFARESGIVHGALVLLGAAATYFAVQMAIASWPVILIAAGLVGVAWIIGQLIKLFKGEGGTIAKYIDKIFGIGTSDAIVKEVKEDWKAIAKWIKEAYASLQDWIRAVEKNPILNAPSRFGAWIGDKLAKGKLERVEEQYDQNVFAFARTRGAFTTDGIMQHINFSHAVAGNNSVTVNVHGNATKETADEIARKVKAIHHEHNRRAKSRLQKAPG